MQYRKVVRPPKFYEQAICSCSCIEAKLGHIFFRIKVITIYVLMKQPTQNYCPRAGAEGCVEETVIDKDNQSHDNIRSSMVARGAAGGDDQKAK